MGKNKNKLAKLIDVFIVVMIYFNEIKIVRCSRRLYLRNDIQIILN